MAIHIRRDELMGCVEKEFQLLSVNFAVAWLIVNEFQRDMVVPAGRYESSGEVLLRQCTKKELGRTEGERIGRELESYWAELKKGYAAWYKKNNGSLKGFKAFKVPAVGELRRSDGLIFCRMKYHLEERDGNCIMVFDKVDILDEVLTLDDAGNIVPAD